MIKEISWPIHFLDCCLQNGSQSYKLAALYSPGQEDPGNHCCRRLSLPQGHSAAGRIGSVEENS
jgi:hypothetical protein